MKIDIRRYLSLRDSLVGEKTRLEQRLREINEALGNVTSTTAATAQQTTAPAPVASRGRGRRSSGISLREAVLQVTAAGPLTKEEILNRVQQMGYRFTTKNPLNSLGVILYGKNPKFRNQDGRFSPAGGAGSTSTSSGIAASGSNGVHKGRGRRRIMSPEARARIAAAQRARWAKTKGGK